MLKPVILFCADELHESLEGLEALPTNGSADDKELEEEGGKICPEPASIASAAGFLCSLCSLCSLCFRVVSDVQKKKDRLHKPENTHQSKSKIVKWVGELCVVEKW
mmetsp:Transcript_19370/g.38353  ORF Transcript_19370/g.38353 Transcript_19370/m.38353 type:complete len:106 (+) Transcript_19370:86-403(+)